ncbi:hypothetical protein IL252_15800 [Halomicrobium sp. IBSBa]|uniref:hypothetical protein n=1 Tax=Halomicrobium sp. IBSBa TaxID=2778916 RepID=UPI001ABEEF9C|nr:hypothetical protein [Halomicrobium sp. IBSBa]MBO4249279.1 hypothetical protein [Halomicrobium sp. IBSBa]
MSIVADSIQLLDEEVAAFAFLPSINYFFVYWQTKTPGILLISLSLFALLFSAIGYNILSSVNFTSFNKSLDNNSEDSNTLDGVGLVISLVVLIGWVGLFVNSILELLYFLDSSSIWPPLLIATSTIFIFLSLSDIVLDQVFGEHYDEES